MTPRRHPRHLDRAAPDGRVVVNLRHAPAGVRYGLAIAVTTVVGALAWFVTEGDTVPSWVSDWLVPALGWLAILIGLGALAVRLYGRRLSRRDGPPEP